MNASAPISVALLLLLFQGANKTPQPEKKAANSAVEPSGEPLAKVAEKKVTDHDSIDALVAALYDVISGPKEEKRDWKRFASLFVKGGKLQALTMGRDGKRRFIEMTPQEYIERSGKWAETNGLYERETHRRPEVYGHIAHVFSSYELRVGDQAFEADKKADLTGINSIQCCQLDGKWRILSILWEDTRSAGPIPDRYQAKPARKTPGRDVDQPTTRPAHNGRQEGQR